MKDSDVKISRAEPEDIPAILELMREFAEFENLLDFLEITEEILHQTLFGEDSFVRCLMAHDHKKPVAYAFFFPSFSSFRGQKSVYLEDIFITEKYRQHGVGEKLLKAVAGRGKEFGAERMDFQVLQWNTPAVEFYKKHAATMDADERHFKFTDKAFAKLTE